MYAFTCYFIKCIFECILNAFLTTYGFGNHCLTVYGIVIVFITTIEHCDVFEKNDSSRQKQLSLETNCFFCLWIFKAKSTLQCCHIIVQARV